MNFIDRLFYRYQSYRKWRGLPEPMPPKTAELTRMALQIANEKAGYIGLVNAQWDLPEGGGTLRIRKPVEYVRAGK
jgi:hypothetical protein